jgi:hypothetical protein
MVFRDSKGRSFGKRAVRGVILGVPEETKGCVIFLPHNKKVIVTQHVKYIQTLFEAQNASLLTWSSPGNGGASLMGDKTTERHRSSATGVTTRTSSQRKPSQRLRDAMSACIKAIDETPEYVCNIMTGDPVTYKSAMKRSNAKDWQAAVDLELDTLRNNQTWIAMPKPKTVKPLHSKWV